MRIAIVLLAWTCFSSFTPAQTTLDSNNSDRPQTSSQQPSSAKHDVGSGAGEIGKGVAKGAGGAARATGSAAVDLATLHPVNAATDLGKGALGTGKTVG